MDICGSWPSASHPAAGPSRAGFAVIGSPGIGGRGSAAAGRRAWVGWAGSLAADEIVTGFPQEDIVAVHALPGPAGDSGPESRS